MLPRVSNNNNNNNNGNGSRVSVSRQGRKLHHASVARYRVILHRAVFSATLPACNTVRVVV